MTDALRLLRLSSDEINPWLEALADLRIEVFREFPYLYDGSHDYERRYLRTYAESHRGVLVVALAGDEVIGAATGLPMTDESEAFRRPFMAQGLDVDGIFYFGESVLRQSWRGRGIGVDFIRSARTSLVSTDFIPPCSVPWIGRGIIRYGRRTMYPWMHSGKNGVTSGSRT